MEGFCEGVDEVLARLQGVDRILITLPTRCIGA